MTVSSHLEPRVSVVLPTYNRQPFLASAFAAIQSQDVSSIEVIVVDDGSTDDTRTTVDALSRSASLPVRYAWQENRGAYGARNTGIALARGEYVAFYDSDDVWLPVHLRACVAALDANPDVDWVYSAAEIVDLDTQKMLDPNCFYQHGRPRPFMNLHRDERGPLFVITDPAAAIRCQIDHGLFCGLQNSVIRRRVFDKVTLEEALRNEAEDQTFAIRALAAGFRLAYFDAVHVRYHVHAGNSSAAGMGSSLEKHTRVYELLVKGYERLNDEIVLPPDTRRALRRRIASEIFWHIGYMGYWAAGHRRQALAAYRRALRVWPWDVRQWKTFLLAAVRTAVNAAPSAAAGSGPR